MSAERALAVVDGRDPERPGSDLAVRQADLGRSRPPRWAWQDRIVVGYLNLLLGNEGVGKGTLAAWIIGKLTRGELPGDLRGHPVGVGVLGDEDSFDDVWTPRLHAAGADLDRVVQIERPDGGFVDVREDREKLAAVVRTHRLGLLFCDQLLDNLGVTVNDWRQKPVRDALQPLRALARELRIPALGGLHPNKRAESFRELVAGAPAFNAVSRSSLLLAQHPEDDAVRVLVRGKGNLSLTPPGVEFRIEEHRFLANGHEFKVPLAQGFSDSGLTVGDLLEKPSAANEHSKVADACEIIQTLLPRDGAWHAAKPIKEACERDGIDDRTAQRAKSKLGLEHRRTSTFPAETEWRWATGDTGSPIARTDVSVATDATAEAGKSPPGSSHDTHDTHDSACTWRDSGASGRTDDELQALVDQERMT